MHKKLKEIKISPSTHEHDLAYRLKALREFLTKGHPVRFTVCFRGREMAHPEIGQNLLNRVLEDIKDLGTPNKPAMNGRDLSVTVNPK